MRFIIHGAGAIGSLVGGMLAESGVETVLIARAAHAEAVNQNGLLIKSKAGERRVRQHLSAVAAPAELEPQEADDVIVITVKSGQTAASVQSLREVFPAETPVFCLQNGVRNEESAAQRFLRVYGAMPGISATLLLPGEIAATHGLTISLGNYPLGCDEFAHAVGEQLTGAGFNVTTHERVMAVKWSKLMLNLNNATLAISDNYVQLAYAVPETANFMADVIEEGLHVLDAAGISLEDAHNPLDLRAQVVALRNAGADAVRRQAAERLDYELRTYPSTWMDIKRKRGETEAGYFNGEIILLGEKYGVPTPYNTTLLNVVETMANEGLEPGHHSLDELAALVEQRRLRFYDS